MALPCAAEVGGLEELVDFVATKADSTPAWSADSETKVDMMGMAMALKGTILVKGEMSIMENTMDMGGQKMTMRQVVDENGVLWSENAGGGRKPMVFKVSAEEREKATAATSAVGSPVDPSKAPQDMLKEMQGFFDLTFKGVVPLYDRKSYLVEGKAKPDAVDKLDKTGMMEQMGMALDGIRMWFDTEDGLTRKVEMLGKEGKPFITQVFSNVNVKPEITEDTFKYTPPEGAHVIDPNEMAGMGMPGAPGPGAGR